MGDPYSQRMAGNRGRTIDQSEDTDSLNTGTEGTPKELLEFVFENIAASSVKDVFIRPPADTVWRLTALSFEVAEDSDASSGSHQIQILPEGGSAVTYWLQAKADFNEPITIQASEILSTTTSQVPSTTIGQVMSPKGGLVNENNGIRFRYTNSMDVTQENTLILGALVTEVAV